MTSPSSGSPPGSADSSAEPSRSADLREPFAKSSVSPSVKSIDHNGDADGLVGSQEVDTDGVSHGHANARGIAISPSGASVTRPTAHDQGPAKPQRHNFVVMVAYLVIQRVGWIFKTESIIMPAVADSIGVGGWLRGCLPVLSRFGLSIPPLFSSQRVRGAPRKRSILVATSLAMSVSFLVLAWVWLVRLSMGPMFVAVAFLAIYSLFFMAVGVNQLVLGTLTGKLIPADRRGELLLVANFVGSATAIGAAWWLLPRWLSEPSRLVYVFIFTGVAFGVNAIVARCISERPDDHDTPSRSPTQLLGRAWGLLRDDRMFRRAALIAALFGLSFALFPHYQAIARGQMGLPGTDMMWWVVVQNIGTAVFSIFVGPLADRRGNRSVLRGIMLSVLLAPLLAISLPHVSNGAKYFPLVFLLVGMTPVTIRILHNYVLELSPVEDHPLYLSTLSLVVALPVMCSPLLGMVIDARGFTEVFVGVAAMVFVAWCLTWRLSEPRHA